MTDFENKHGLQTVTTYFKAIFLDNIHRAGATELLTWLETETDFFTAPAAAKYHSACPGGLLFHSLHVYRRLHEIAVRDLAEPDNDRLSAETEETVAILGLLHDVCKVGVYHEEMKRRRNPKTGVWEDCRGYAFRDPLPLGHGEKSLYLIARRMELKDHEALAVRWHMGAYDTAARADLRDLSAAMAATPWVWCLHEADMCATHIDEKEGETT